MTFSIAYGAALIVFGILDAVWLSVMGPRLYRPTLGSLMLDQLRWAPALAFYLLFPIGLVHFAVLPAVASGSLASALGNGAFLGLLAYATYDLTNHATLRAWTTTLTLVDVAYGTVASGLVAAGGFLGVRALAAAGWL